MGSMRSGDAVDCRARHPSGRTTWSPVPAPGARNSRAPSIVQLRLRRRIDPPAFDSCAALESTWLRRVNAEAQRQQAARQLPVAAGEQPRQLGVRALGPAPVPGPASGSCAAARRHPDDRRDRPAAAGGAGRPRWRRRRPAQKSSKYSASLTFSASSVRRQPRGSSVRLSHLQPAARVVLALVVSGSRLPIRLPRAAVREIAVLARHVEAALAVPGRREREVLVGREVEVVGHATARKPLLEVLPMLRKQHAALARVAHREGDARQAHDRHAEELHARIVRGAHAACRVDRNAVGLDLPVGSSSGQVV